MRKASVSRVTAETKIKLSLNLDGTGKSRIDTTIAFMDHMLTLFSRHSLIDLTIKASGDTEVDQHHLVEDLGIVLGLALKKALGKKVGIFRYGNFLMPMDESLSYVAVDLSGRPHLSYIVKFRSTSRTSQKFDYSLIREFFKAVSNSAGMTLHIKSHAGENNHHIAESIFKGFAKAIAQAVKIESKKVKSVPSTKNLL